MNVLNEIEILEQIRDILQTHIGKESAIASNKIASMLGIEAGASSVTIRSLITKTMIKFQMPIASNGKGYFIIANDSEFSDYMDSLQGRVEKILNRKFLVMYFWQKQDEELEFTTDLYDIPDLE